MQPVTYRKRISEGGVVYVLASFILIVNAAMHIFQPPIWESPGVQDLVYHGIAALTYCALAAICFGVTLPRYNTLQADGDKLIYKRFGRNNAWPWRDISAFTIARGWRGPRIEFTIEGEDRSWWTKDHAAGRIHDIYGTPLADIAATLNEYREQALEGGTVTDGS